MDTAENLLAEYDALTDEHAAIVAAEDQGTPGGSRWHDLDDSRAALLDRMVAFLRPVQPPTRDDRIAAATETASLAFWASVAESFPDATTGDFPPDGTLAINHAMRKAVDQWTAWNSPSMAVPNPFADEPTDAELAAAHDSFTADAADVDDTPATVGIAGWPVTDADRVAFGRWQHAVAYGDTVLGFREWQTVDHA